MIPPKTKRYCTICNNYQWYIYDPMLNHSFCRRCKRSSLFSKKEKPKQEVKETK
jgi:hypothetical protein